MLRRAALIALLVAAPHAAARADTTYATLAGNLGATGENFAVGGENRWALSSVVRALLTAKREDDRTR